MSRVFLGKNKPRLPSPLHPTDDWGYTVTPGQSSVNQHLWVLLHWATPQPVLPQPVYCMRFTQVQDLTLGFIEPQTNGLRPLIVKIPLQSLPALQQVNPPNQLGAIYELAEKERFLSLNGRDMDIMDRPLSG
ncbi:hypothetical protein DUI87_22293 [Hirundo rustica rustica]|uniref:Uncharacterized protein n=1 Tax=Hirundo rustica rustica TaxID=333673 RepID=A0A3M0JLM5_HIRRU|nr:hypothetical protein DUI87_22293 [Hirundo rustica rustica]